MKEVLGRFSLKKTLAVFFVLGMATSLIFSDVAQAVTYGGGNVQSYASGNPISDGNIVQLDGSEKNRVKVAPKEEVHNIFGVTVNVNKLPVAISNSELENEVFVAVSGTYDVLVSNEAGTIKEGDYLTLSSISGVAMSAGKDEVNVIGRANASFNGKNNVLGSSELINVLGSTDGVVYIGSIPVTIDIRRNPNTPTTKVNVPEFLQAVGEAIAEKEVSPLRAYLSSGITVATLIATIAVIYAGVRNSVISIGRNPMSKKSIFRALIGVILTGLLILVIGLFAVYLLLRL